MSFPISWYFLRFMSIELMMPSNRLILCHPLLLLPSIFSSIRIFLNESALCIRWPKYWTFSFNISPSNEYPALISFRMDRLDLLAVQGTLKSSPTPQFKSIYSSIFHRARTNNFTICMEIQKNLNNPEVDMGTSENPSASPHSPSHPRSSCPTLSPIVSHWMCLPLVRGTSLVAQTVKRLPAMQET